MERASRPATIEDLKRLLKALNDEGVDYLLIGGYALNALGNPGAVVIINAGTVVQAVAEIAQPPAAFRKGRQSVRCSAPELLRP